MFTINVDLTLNAPIDYLFEAISDHGAYTRFKAVRHAKVVEPGCDELNGLGALREVHVGPLQFMERITVFERPIRMDYHIEASEPVTMQHDMGSIHLKPLSNTQTQVIWQSQGRIQIPLLGWLVDKKFTRDGTKGFSSILKQIEREYLAQKS